MCMLLLVKFAIRMIWFVIILMNCVFDYNTAASSLGRWHDGAEVSGSHCQAG